MMQKQTIKATNEGKVARVLNKQITNSDYAVKEKIGLQMSKQNSESIKHCYYLTFTARNFCAWPFSQY